MSVVFLVRHGQASFGTHDYDRLSERGRAQSRVLGATLSRSGLKPERIITGTLTRQRDTAREAIAAAGWDTAVVADPGWDEFDAENLMRADPQRLPVSDAGPDPRTFQKHLERASARWASSEHDGDYLETFAGFTRRIDAALGRALDGVESGATIVVFSSAGAIAWVAARLIDGGFPQWLALNRVAVNTGVTKVVRGRSGMSLVGFNDHCHLTGDAITYR